MVVDEEVELYSQLFISKDVSDIITCYLCYEFNIEDRGEITINNNDYFSQLLGNREGDFDAI